MSELVRENLFVVAKDSSLRDALLDLCSFFKAPVLQSWFDNNRLLVNGSLVKNDIDVVVGDTIVLLTSQSLEPPTVQSYSIVYDDDSFFVVDKPANLPVHPAGKYYFNTLTMMLSRDGFESSFPINRLDKETSGLVVFAKSSSLAAKLHKIFSQPETSKEYLAIVFGRTEKLFEVNAPLKKTQVGDIRDFMLVSLDGLPSKTVVKTLKYADKYSYVRVFLHSGRRHQIRAHLSTIGHAIVGDKQYGSHPELFISHVLDPLSLSDDDVIATVGARRQFLHCVFLRFVHPKTGSVVFFDSKLPKDIFNFLKDNF